MTNDDYASVCEVSQLKTIAKSVYFYFSMLQISFPYV